MKLSPSLVFAAAAALVPSAFGQGDTCSSPPCEATGPEVFFDVFCTWPDTYAIESGQTNSVDYSFNLNYEDESFFSTTFTDCGSIGASITAPTGDRKYS